MTKIGGIETLPCIGEIQHAFVLLKALHLMEWRGLWKTRTAPFHAMGLQLSDLIGSQDWTIDYQLF